MLNTAARNISTLLSRLPIVPLKSSLVQKHTPTPASISYVAQSSFVQMTSVTRKRTESTSPVKNEHRNKHTKLDEDFDQDVDFDQDALLEATTQAEQESKSGSSPSSAPKTSSQSSAAAHASSQSSTTPCVSSQNNSAFSSAPDGLFKPPSGVQNLRHDDPRVEQETMDPEWYAKLEEEINSSYFKDLKAFLGREAKAGKRIYPPAHLVHSWSRLTPLRNVKIVVVGQDPYHGPNQACGHSFSVPKGISVPGSLQNIYKELRNEYGADFQAPKHGCLDGWAKQGVLLLNACLTVTAGQAGSHHNQGWERFTQTILRTIAAEAAGAPKASVKNSTIATMFNKATKPSDTSDPPASHGSRGVVFLAWGLPAQKTLAAAGITEKSSNILLLKSPHPSPLSAHRGFLGNGHFKKANEWLESSARYGPGGAIRWDLL